MRRWLPWLPAVLALPWWLAGTYLVPPLIRQAYAGTSHPLLNGLISGQAVHTVDQYLYYWEYLVWLGVIALLAAAATAVMTERAARTGWLTARRALLLTLLILMPAGFALRWFDYTGDSLSFDETYSIAVAGAPWGAFLEAMRAERWNGVVFYLLLRPAALISEADWLMCGVSLIFGAALIPVIFLLGNLLKGPACGLLSATLVTVQAFHVEWSQKVRPYALSALLAALSTLLFLRGVERPTRRVWAGYTILMLLGFYTHVMGLLLLPAHWLALLFLRRRDVPWKYVIVSNAILGVLGALPRMLASVGATRRMVYLELFSWDEFLGVIKSFSGHGGNLLLGLRILLLVVALVFALRLWRESWGGPAGWRTAVVILWLAVPFSIVAYSSAFVPVLVDRGLMPFLPALVLLCGLAIAVLRPRIVAAVFFALLLTLAVDGLVNFYDLHGIEEWQWATDRFAREARPGDAVVIFHPARFIPFTYHVRRGGNSLDDIEIHHPPPEEQAAARHEIYYRLGIPHDLGDQVAARHRRVWVVLSHDDTPGMGREVYRDELLRQINAHYRLSERYYFPMVRLFLFVREEEQVGGRAIADRAATAPAQSR